MDDMGPSSPTEGKLREATSRRGPIANGFNHHEHEFAGLVKAHQSWVMAIFDDEKLGGAPILTEDMADDTLNAVRFFSRCGVQCHRDHSGAGLRRRPGGTGFPALPDD